MKYIDSRWSALEKSELLKLFFAHKAFKLTQQMFEENSKVIELEVKK